MFKLKRVFAVCSLISLGTLTVHATNSNVNKDKLHYPFLTPQIIKKLTTKYSNLTVLEAQSTEHMITYLRNKDTDIIQFRKQADRVIRILIEQGLASIQKKKFVKESPIGFYDSHEFPFTDEDICIVSILRSGNAFLNETFKILPGVSVGQILIQRNEETAEPTHYYSKLPKKLENKQILLVDPMLATGGSANTAIKVLKNHGVKEENIMFLNLISCEEGISQVMKHYPQIKIITAQIDPILLETTQYLAPGIGDFGDRYFGTMNC